MQPLTLGGGSFLLPVIFSAATAASIGGCSPMRAQHTAESARPDVPAKVMPVKKDECEDIAQHGELYSDTCRYYTDQCYDQAIRGESGFEISNHEGVLFNSDSYAACTQTSKYFTLLRGPIPYKHLPYIYRRHVGDHLMIQKKSRLRVLEPKNFSKEAEATAADLLAERGFLKKDESNEDVIEGRIAAAQKSKINRKELIVFLLDPHNVHKAQPQIVRTTRKLHSRGLTLIGAEGQNAFKAVLCEEQWNPDGWHSTEQLACKIGTSALMIGLEDFDVAKRHYDLSMFLSIHREPTEDSPCEWFDKAIVHEELAGERSKILLNNLLKKIHEEKKMTAAMIIGAAHLNDLMAICEAEDVNYIAIAVSALVELFEEGFDEELEEYAEYAAAFNSICD